MKTSVILIVAIIILIFAAGCTQTKNENITNQDQAKDISGITAAQSTTTTSATQPDLSTVNVAIREFAFEPAVLTVKIGTRVVWTNYDSVLHNVQSADGSIKSKTISNGQTVAYTFNKPGTYDYICGLHPSMKGKVIVE